MGGNGPEGCITDPRNTTLEETSWGYRRMEALFERGQGSERAVTDMMDI
jgi:hypothetical protein